ncbi:MAG TPA: hypothetical protein VIO35_03295 [Chloroflexota bacterium]
MAKLPSGLSDIIDDEEDLARFLNQSGQFTTLTVKPSAFLPSPRSGTTSVFRHGSEPRTSLWLLFSEHVSVDLIPYGAAIVKASQVRAVGLEVSPVEPPPRHADISGWASLEIDPDRGKAQRKEQALLLAQQAVLVRY